MLERSLPGAQVRIALRSPAGGLGLTQVHGEQILRRHQGENLTPEADGHWTSACHLPLYVRTADCLPVLIALPGQAVAALHAGWRGVDLRIVNQLYQQWDDAGFVLEDAHWVVGPHICSNCFAMRKPELDAFLDGAHRQKSVKASDAGYLVNLLDVLLDDLRASGWPVPRYVDRVGGCTFHDSRWPGSRRSGGTTQRIFSSIELLPGS